MNLAIDPPKSNRIRAAASANPALSPDDLAKMLGIRSVEGRRALAVKPRRRVKRIAP